MDGHWTARPERWKGQRTVAAEKHVSISHGQGFALTVTTCNLVGERRSFFGLGGKALFKRASRKFLFTSPSFTPVAITAAFAVCVLIHSTPPSSSVLRLQNTKLVRSLLLTMPDFPSYEQFRCLNFRETGCQNTVRLANRYCSDCRVSSLHIPSLSSSFVPLIVSDFLKARGYVEDGSTPSKAKEYGQFSRDEYSRGSKIDGRTEKGPCSKFDSLRASFMETVSYTAHPFTGEVPNEVHTSFPSRSDPSTMITIDSPGSLSNMV